MSELNVFYAGGYVHGSKTKLEKPIQANEELPEPMPLVGYEFVKDEKVKPVVINNGSKLPAPMPLVGYEFNKDVNEMDLGGIMNNERANEELPAPMPLVGYEFVKDEDTVIVNKDVPEPLIP